MSPKIYHRNLSQYLVEEIGRRIIRGTYPPGEALPTEEELSREMEVSRGVLREAIKILTQKGLIQTRTRTGSVVLPRENWNLFDPDILVWRLSVEDKTAFLKNVTQVRRLIESESAREAAIRATEEEIAHISGLAEKMRLLLEDKPSYLYEEFLAADVAFHSAIMNASHNELLAHIGTMTRTAVYKARENDTADFEIHKESFPFHLELLKSIAARDPEAAFTASQSMFDNVWIHII